MIMAHKVSYKVVSEQGETLKKVAKDMDNYVNQLDNILSKIGGDELFHSVKSDLKKFKKQLEEEKTVLNLSGQILQDVVQVYSGTEKKNVQKVDKTKAHTRDFYKRPVAVASAGGAAAAASGGSAAAASAVNVAGSGNVITENVTNVQATVIDQSTTNVITEGLSKSAADVAAGAAGAAAGGFGAAAVVMGATTVAASAAAKLSGKVAAKKDASKEEPVNVVAENEGTEEEDSNGE